MFTYKNLSLESDFEYNKRSKLKSLGFTEETIAEIFADPVNFVMYLSPVSCSALIGNEADFVNVCDYLFYFCASCYDDDLLYELYAKTLFELLRNYSYKWKLRLKHVMTALKNLGFREDAMFCKKHFEDCLANRIDIVQRYCKSQSKSYKFSLPSYPAFFKKRLEAFKSSQPVSQPGPTPEDRLKCVKNLIHFISNLLVTHSHLTEFKSVYGHDWISQLILIHIFTLLSSEQSLNTDSFVKEDLSLLFYQQFNSFSVKQWSGREGDSPTNDKDKDKELKNKTASSKPTGNADHSKPPELNNEEANASLDISEIISQVGQYDGIAHAFTWDRDAVPALDHLGIMDHHHNMVQRVQLLPPTFRGYAIKKNVAFLQLQLLMDVGKYHLSLIHI